MDFDNLLEEKFDTVLDGVTNTTDPANALQDVFKTPDYAHIKAATLVLLLMLCRHFGHFVIPFIVKFLTQTQQPTVLLPAKQE